MMAYQIIFLLHLATGANVASPSIEYYASLADCESRIEARSAEVARGGSGLWELKAAACRPVGTPA